MDVSSLARPLRSQHLLLPTAVVPFEIEPVRRGMETDKTSIRTRVVVIEGRLKRPTPEIESFLHIRMPENPLTTPALLVNRGPQVDSDASDRNVKRHKRLHARNVDGQFRFKIQKKSSEIEGLGETHYGDKGAITGDYEQELDKGNLDNDNDREEAPYNPDIQIWQLSISTTSRIQRLHHVQRTTNATTMAMIVVPRTTRIACIAI